MSRNINKFGRSLVIGLFIVAVLVAIVVIGNAVGLWKLVWLEGDPHEAEAPPVAVEPLYGLDLVGCEEHVCIYSFPNGKLPSDGAYCYLSIAAAKPTSKWTTEMVCP